MQTTIFQNPIWDGVSITHVATVFIAGN